MEPRTNMNEQDLLSIGELLEHPELYPDVDERDIRDLAIGYHAVQADYIAEEIMTSLFENQFKQPNITADDVAKAIREHAEFPRYAFHIDELNRNASAETEPSIMEAFNESMEHSLDRVLSAASKVLSGELLTGNEIIKDKAD